jgi:[ribosomal protein S18]-alanine N-acetyltransferase
MSLCLRPMVEADLAAVMRLELRAYPFPWSEGNFRDSLSSGYHAVCLVDEAEPQALLGYLVAMDGVAEAHLLNIAIDPARQRQGLARTLLDALVARSVAVGAEQLWLEVRVSNLSACTLYERYGFESVGLRRGYYPAAGGREDARVMRLALPAAGTGVGA